MKLLATVMNEIELEMIKDLFDTNNIPVIAKHRESGEFMVIYTGSSIYGADIYVPEELYDEAKSLYDSFFNGQYEE